MTARAPSATGFDRYFEKLMTDPEFARGYLKARRRILSSKPSPPTLPPSPESTSSSASDASDSLDE